MTALIALTILSSNHVAAVAKESNPRATLAARQDLNDKFCVAMADGRIAPSERADILRYAKKILKPEEYSVYKQKLDALCPPPAAPVKREHVQVKHDSDQVKQKSMPAKHVVASNKKKTHKPSEWDKISKSVSESLAKVKNTKLWPSKNEEEIEYMVTDQSSSQDTQKTASVDHENDDASIMNDPVAKIDSVR
jgi:hypothetical protein